MSRRGTKAASSAATISHQCHLSYQMHSPVLRRSRLYRTPESSNGAGRRLWERRHTAIAAVTLLCVVTYLVMAYGLAVPASISRWSLWIALAVCGGPLVVELALRLFKGQFGSDLLAGISIITAIVLEEYLAGTLVVLMLSGGAALESFAVRRASSVLDALARRMPSRAHRQTESGLIDIALDEIQIGDVISVLPHEVCPVDGVVVSGHGSMDEAYLTGE